MNPPKIVLINPRISSEERYGRKTKIGGQQAPLGLLQLQSYIQHFGVGNQVTCDFIDLNFENLPDLSGYDYVGITMPTVAYSSVKELLDRIPVDVRVIVGGPHMSALPVQTMIELPRIDIGVIGEGEPALDFLIGWSKKPYNFIWKEKKDMYRKAPEAEPIDLDKMHSPAWTKELIKRYHPPLLDFRRKPVISMITGRGCQWRKCKFCSQTMKPNRKSVESTISEIGIYKSVFKIKEIAFVDDNFCSDNFIGSFCRKFQEKYDIDWTCMARVSDLKENQKLKVMREANCWQIALGIESLDDRILWKMRKGHNANQAKRVVQTAVDLGIAIKGFIIIGYPGETKETLENTMETLKTLPLRDVVATIFTPLPGAPLWNKYETTEFDKLNMWTGVDLDGWTAHELLEKQKEIYKNAILNWETWREQRKSLKTFGQLGRGFYTLSDLLKGELKRR